MNTAEYITILADTLANGGGSFNATTSNKVSKPKGYWVANTDILPTLIIPVEQLAGLQALSEKNYTDAAIDALDAVCDLALFCDAIRHCGRANSFLGTWVDDGKIYVDCSTIIANRENALSVAKRRGELAIWSNAEGKAIPTGIEEK